MTATAVPDLDALSDHDLLLGGVRAAITENRASADRWARLITYFRRREADQRVREAHGGPFSLTARQHTVVEVGELWGLAESWIRRQLNVALWLDEHFPFAWGLCRAGQLDAYRATTIADTARQSLDLPEEYAAIAKALERFLTRHLTTVPGIEVPIVTCTPKQLRNKLAYEIRKLRARDAEARFARAHEDRSVQTSDGEDGISWLTLAATTDQIQLARHRLTLAAKQQRAQGDKRTLDQLRTDLAVELLTHGVTTDLPLPTYARPVINLTVPIQTVMGISDDPGVLSGGTVIPAGLARMIAQQPGATWHRMLTDPAGQCVERSTTSYRPTPAIWGAVVAEHGTCFRPGCDLPATEAELDHRIPWPTGPTSPRNLWPACKTDHTAKHSPGFRIVQTRTGAFALVTPAGFAHEVRPTEHPTSSTWRDAGRIQFSATELLDAVDHLRAADEAARPLRIDLHWEYDLPHFRDSRYDQAYDEAS